MKLLTDRLSEMGITHAQFAASIKVHPTSVSQYLNRHSRPPLDVFARIVKETGLPCEALLAMFLEKPLLKRRPAR